MKIIHIINSLGQGGAERVLTTLCINDKINEHLIITIMKNSFYDQQLIKNNIQVYNLNILRIFDVFKFFNLIKILLRERPDVLQTWLYHSDLLGGIAGKIVGIKKIFWNIRHSDVSSHNLKIRTKIVIKILAILSKYIPSGIIFCSNESYLNHIQHGYSNHNSTLINNGVDLNEFKPNKINKESIKKLYNFKSNIIIGMIARYHPYKDHYTLLESLSNLKQKKIAFHCVLAGTSIDKNNKKLINDIQKFDIQEEIILLGPHDNISQIMNMIDLNILITKSESFPNVIAEAMACGTPCISSDQGEAVNIIGETGWVIDFNDPDILLKKIIEAINLWKDENNWKLKKKLARDRIRDHYSMDKMISSYEKFWKK